jgi:hypothetical protein
MLLVVYNESLVDFVPSLEVEDDSVNPSIHIPVLFISNITGEELKVRGLGAARVVG